MGAKRRRSYDKKPPQRPESARRASGETFLITVEGKATELAYLKKIREKLSLKAIAVEIVHGNHTDPIGIVKEAIEFRNRQLAKVAISTVAQPFDRTWVIFDRERQNHPRREQLPKALQLAADNGIEVALSIPTFEFWLLLHYEFTTKAFDGCEPATKALKKFIQQYEKGNLPLEELVGKVRTAITHAEKCRNHWRGVGGDMNPSTDVDLLVIALNDAAHEDCRFP
jgi:hypothetical protein